MSYPHTVLTREDVFYQAVSCYSGTFVYLVGYDRFLTENPEFSTVCAIISGLFLLLGFILTIASFHRTPPNYAIFILRYMGLGIDIAATWSIITGFVLALPHFPSKPPLFQIFFCGGWVLMMTLIARKMFINFQQVPWHRANVVRGLKILALAAGLFVLILVPINQLSVTGAVWTLAAGLVLLAIAMIIEVYKVE